MANLTYKNHTECELTQRNNYEYELQNKSNPGNSLIATMIRELSVRVNKIFQLTELPGHSQLLSEIRIGIKATLIKHDCSGIQKAYQEPTMYYTYDTNYHHYIDLNILGRKQQQTINNHVY